MVFRYDSFGRLTNVTFPTGQVSSFRSDTDSSVHVQVETSSKDDVTITTNLSASGAFYTLLQGEPRGDLGTLRQRAGQTPLEEEDTRNKLLLRENRKSIATGFSLYYHLICKPHQPESCKFSPRSFRVIFHCLIPLSSEQRVETPLAANQVTSLFCHSNGSQIKGLLSHWCRQGQRAGIITYT